LIKKVLFVDLCFYWLMIQFVCSRCDHFAWFWFANNWFQLFYIFQVACCRVHDNRNCILKLFFCVAHETWVNIKKKCTQRFVYKQTLITMAKDVMSMTHFSGSLCIVFEQTSIGSWVMRMNWLFNVINWKYLFRVFKYSKVIRKCASLFVKFDSEVPRE
jgi:hypothetical protein